MIQPEICHGHYVKKAAYDQLSTELAEAVAVIREILEWDGSVGAYSAIKNYDAHEKARALLSKHEKGS